MTRETRRSVWPVVAVLVLLPVLYVASIGPAYRFEVVEPSDYPTIYAPVYAIARFETPGNGLAWWIQLWLGRRLIVFQDPVMGIDFGVQ